MDIHKPKAAHSIREFLIEIGTIICGILIALGLEQGVEWARRQGEIRETRATLKEELEHNLGTVQSATTVEPCIGRRLAELHAILDQWGSTGSYKTPTLIGSPPMARILFVRYEAAQSAGRLALLPAEEQARIGTIVQVLKRFDEVEYDAIAAWARLRILQSGANSLSASDRTMIREAFQRAAEDDFMLRVTENQAIPRAKSYGFVPDSDGYADMMRFSRTRAGDQTPSTCLPMSTLPDEADRLNHSVTKRQF
jgi:hypothetical protein